MARPEYHLESPMSSRSRRSSRVPPPVPMPDDSLGSEDEDQHSPPRRSSRGRDRARGWDQDGERETAAARDRLVLKEWDCDRRHREEISMQTPDSRGSSASHRPSRRYQPDPRGHQYTPPHSVSSSRASTRGPHPPMASMTRPSTAEAPYRRPSLRELAPAAYDDPDARHALRRRHSHSRSVHAVPSAPVLRETVYVSGPESNGEDTETTYDSWDVRRMPRRGGRPRRLSLDDRSPSRAEPRTSQRRSRPRRGDPGRLDDEDCDEMDSRHALPVDHESPPPPHPRSRPRSRAPPARPIPEPDVTESEDSQDDDDRLRDRFDRRGKHRHRRHVSHKTDPRRRRSESHMDPSPTPKRYVLSSIFGGTPGSSHRARPSPKRYYDTEVKTLEKVEVDRHHRHSASLRRSNTVSGSQAAASHHHSVSSTRRSSSSTFLGNFFGPSLHSYHHHATDKRVKL